MPFVMSEFTDSVLWHQCEGIGEIPSVTQVPIVLNTSPRQI